MYCQEGRAQHSREFYAKCKTILRGDFISDLIKEPKLLMVKDFCKYMNIGERNAKKLLSEPNCPYVFRLGGKIMVNKTIFDRWIDKNTGK